MNMSEIPTGCLSPIWGEQQLAAFMRLKAGSQGRQGLATCSAHPKQLLCPGPTHSDTNIFRSPLFLGAQTTHCCISFWTRVKFWLRKALTRTQIMHHKFNIFDTNEQTPEFLTSSHNITFVIWWHHTKLFPPGSRAKCYLLKASSICLNLIKYPSATQHKDFLLKEINKHLTT